MSDFNARTWVFRPAARTDGQSTAQLWRWHASLADGRTTSSVLLFETLADCVRDAQQHGFSGEVDPANGSFTPTGYEISVAAIGSSTRIH